MQDASLRQIELHREVSDATVYIVRSMSEKSTDCCVSKLDVLRPWEGNIPDLSPVVFCGALGGTTVAWSVWFGYFCYFWTLGTQKVSRPLTFMLLTSFPCGSVFFL